jgi:hypothetical protein
MSLLETSRKRRGASRSSLLPIEQRKNARNSSAGGFQPPFFRPMSRRPSVARTGQRGHSSKGTTSTSSNAPPSAWAHIRRQEFALNDSRLGIHPSHLGTLNFCRCCATEVPAPCLLSSGQNESNFIERRQAQYTPSKAIVKYQGNSYLIRYCARLCIGSQVWPISDGQSIPMCGIYEVLLAHDQSKT